MGLGFRLGMGRRSDGGLCMGHWMGRWLEWWLEQRWLERWVHAVAPGLDRLGMA